MEAQKTALVGRRRRVAPEARWRFGDELALHPAHRRRDDRRHDPSPGLPDPDQHRQRAAAVVGTVGAGAGRGDHPDRRPVRPVARIDRRRGADVRGVAGARHRPQRLGPRAQRLSRGDRGLSGRLRDRRRQRLPDRAARAQRLHHHAGDADPAARRRDRPHQRPDPVRSAGAVPLSRQRATGSACPASLWVSAGLYLVGSLHPRLSPLRPRPLCDRRQRRGGARRRHSRSTAMSGRCS